MNKNFKKFLILTLFIKSMSVLRSSDTPSEIKKSILTLGLGGVLLLSTKVLKKRSMDTLLESQAIVVREARREGLEFGNNRIENGRIGGQIGRNLGNLERQDDDAIAFRTAANKLLFYSSLTVGTAIVGGSLIVKATAKLIKPAIDKDYCQLI
jgi:hypothetical protein